MSGKIPTEKRFEEHIERHLQSAGYESVHHINYDRNLCLIREQVIDFIRETQPEEWDRLSEIYGADVKNKVLARISSETSSRGIVDVLRNPVKDRGVNLHLCYFEPKSGMNPDHRRLHRANKFSVVRQFHYSNSNENSIDMALFLNGLPIVTMELKNQLTGQNIVHSEKQYRDDRDPGEPLFRFKRCLVHFCVDNDRVSMTTKLSGPGTSFLPYNRGLENPVVEGGYRTEYLWKDVLRPESLLNILEDFAHVSKEREFKFSKRTKKIETVTKEVLIFPRYHQRDLILQLMKQLRNDGVGTNYLVQHTTGSGKSYSIGWLSHMLTSLYRTQGDTKRMFDTIVVVTDRTVLDDQLRNTIRSLARVHGVVGGVEHGSQELKRYLETGRDIVITTIQKFRFISDTISALGDRTFAVIVDEVHSSQTGELSKEMKKTLSRSDDEDEDAFDYEEKIREIIQARGRQDHISYFGFTGTPKEKTLELFGTRTDEGQFKPFHIYSMHQSIHEGFTLDVLKNYTTFKRYFRIKQIAEKDERIPSRKATAELLRYVDAHERNIKHKVNILLDHWINKGSKEIKGQARGMVVTQSRKQCVCYFREINRQLKERKVKYRCLVGFSGEVSVDGDKFTEAGLNSTVRHHGNVPLGLKDPGYRLLVVANKFQTGFDEPLVQSMYVDKRLGGVQCVQTLSRLNRKASGKTEAFVLDFVNEPEDIEKAFQRFYQSTILEGETDPNRLYDLCREIRNFDLYTPEDLNRFCEIFFNSKRDDGALHPCLDSAVAKFNSIEDAEKREDCRSKIQSYIRLYGYVAQIINFTDIELEKTFVFLKYLNRKLPKRGTKRFTIFDAIDLDSLRVQKIYDKADIFLRSVVHPVPPPDRKVDGAREPEYEFLSKIIEKLNATYGMNLTEDDRDTIHRLRVRLIENPEVKKYMTGDNTQDTKRMFFEREFDKVLLDFVQEQFSFYQKMDGNPGAKQVILDAIYHRYLKEQSLPDNS